MAVGTTGSRIGGVQRQFARVETFGFREFAREASKMERDTRRALFQEIRDAIEPIAERARGYAPVASGRLKSSIRTKVYRTGAGIVAGGGRAPHAPIIEFAYKGGGIVAKGGGFRRSKRSYKSGLRSYKGGVTQRRDYSSLSLRYGPPPRYVYRAVAESEDEVFRDISDTVDATITRFWTQQWNEKD